MQPKGCENGLRLSNWNKFHCVLCKQSDQGRARLAPSLHAKQRKTKEDMATTARRRKSHPISHYWSLVKDIDDSQKMQLVTMLINSVKTADDGKAKRKLDANDYAGIWSDEEYMDADELVDTIRQARHFKDRTKFWDEL